jgi:hypothetical protein
MTALSHQKVIQANSPKFLEEEVARFAKEGWRKTGEPVELMSAELGRPTYWAQTLGFLAEATPAGETDDRHVA